MNVSDSRLRLPVCGLVAVWLLFCVSWVRGASLPGPSYRLGVGGRMDFLSSWDLGRKPGSYNRLQDDVLTMSFWELGELISSKDMVQSEHGWEGTFVRNGNTLRSRIRVEEKAPGHLMYHVEYESADNRNPVFLALTFNPPLFERPLTLTFADGSRQTVSIAPVPLRKKFIWHQNPGNPCVGVRIPLQTGFLTLTGFRAHQALGMKYAPSQGNLQLYFSENLRRGILDLDVRLEPLQVQQVDLKAFFNRGFADEVAHDGKGGWTDEGRLNDLRAMKPGRQVMGNVEMDITDPGTNEGKSCLALGRRPGFLPSVQIPLGGMTIRQLNFLHACTYLTAGEAGHLTVFYEDGQRQEFPVRVRRDIGNWWKPVLHENAWPVWTSANEVCSRVGVYLSRFPLLGKPVKSLSLTSSERDVRWLILGIGGVLNGETAFPRPSREQKLSLTSNSQWRELKVSPPLEGSLLDFSFLQEAPAGRHGPVVVRNGSFEFAGRPGVQARFFGVNLVGGANFMNDAQLAYYLPLIKRYGFNAVRLHNLDFKLLKRGTVMELDGARLDRLFKTFAACKEAGLYVTLDLFVTPCGGYPEAHGRSNTFEMMKAQCLLDPEYRNRLKTYARRLLTTVNPYTGMSLGKDPALISVSFINENSSFFDWAAINSSHPVLSAKVKASFDAWSKGRPGGAKLEDVRDYSRFLTDLHREFYADMKAFLAGLGVTVPSTDMNNGCVLMQYPVRRDFDYVDDHFYIEHPRYPNGNWTSPLEFANTSLGSTFYAQAIHAFASRIEGKPLTMSEYRYCAPNQWRLEGGTLLGALAGMHGVDGLYDFCLGFPFDYQGIPGQEAFLMDQFGTFRDPVNDLGNRLTALLYLRGDMPPATKSYSLVLPADMTQNQGALTWRVPTSRQGERLPVAYQRLALLGRTSIVFEQAKGQNCVTLEEAEGGKPGRLMSREGADPEGEFQSSNGCLRLCPQQNRTVIVTPKTETVTTGERQARGNCLHVWENTCFSTIAASSMDGRSLADSRRILVLHITDVRPGQGADFRQLDGRLRVYSWGRHPFLLRKGKATISLTNDGGGRVTVYALDIRGARGRNVPVVEKDGRLCFEADNAQGEVPAIGYEILRQP